MKTLLRIDSSIRNEGSRSRELADYFETHWRRANEGGQVMRRDLGKHSVPHLDNETLGAFFGHAESRHSAEMLALSDAMVVELKAADEILVACPVYNFGVPSSLKAYVDFVVRNGKTFSLEAGKFSGLLAGKPVCAIVVRGGINPGAGETDFAGNYLKLVFGFMGLDAVDVISLPGTANPELCRRNVEQAQEEIRALARLQPVQPVAGEVAWNGAFTPADRAAISALRLAQARAIEGGDVRAYAVLCAEDVHWMFPGHDVVVGRSQFVEAQLRLASGNRVHAMRKFPLKVERCGELAIEVGRQELELQPGTNGTCPRKQKYMHVFRKTPEGWRFAVLMSNASL